MKKITKASFIAILLSLACVSATAQPTVAAPVPTRSQANVKSIFSDSYTSCATIDFIYGGGTPGNIGGNNYIQLLTGWLECYVWPNYDVSDMTHLHFDIWSVDVPELTFHFGNYDNGWSFAKKWVSFATGSTSWISFDIPLSEFEGISDAAKSRVENIIFEEYSSKTLYIDNIYFYNNTATGLSTPSSTAVSIYPNPATAVINLSQQMAKVDFYTLQGQLVSSVQNTNRVNVSDFSKGMYIIRMTDAAGVSESAKIEIR